jgi:hypothetical protein
LSFQLYICLVVADSIAAYVGFQIHVKRRTGEDRGDGAAGGSAVYNIDG